jgi:hypothetical protein
MLPAWMIDQVKRRKDDEVATHIGDEYEDTRSRPVHRDRSDSGDDDRVLEAGSGGGGNPPPPPPPDYAAQNKAAMELEDHRAKIAQEAQDRADQKKADQLAADKTAFQGKLGGAYNTAENYGRGQLSNMGVEDTYGIMSAYKTALDRAKGMVPELDANPGQYFGSDLWENTLSSERSAERNALTRGYETEVPTGFETTYIPDTADDALIESIIGGQYTEASDYLKRAKDRGTLNDVGYNTASTALNNQRSGAVARANELGKGVLETGRTSLKDIDKQARAGITNWDFGDKYDPASWSSKIKTGATDFTSGLEGKLRNSFGSTEFFDPEAFIAKGGKAQGSVNAGASALKDAISEEEKRRTAGSVGAF